MSMTYINICILILIMMVFLFVEYFGKIFRNYVVNTNNIIARVNPIKYYEFEHGTIQPSSHQK